MKNLLILLIVIAFSVLILILAINNVTPKTLINEINPVSYGDINNEILGFGSNFYGQLGQQNVFKSPVELQKINVENIAEFDAGNKHSIALTPDGEVIQNGVNGIEDESNLRFIEQKVDENVSKLNDVVSISAGADYSIALKSDGTVWAWGKNLTGQLGQGNNDESIYALKIKELKDITQISAGYKFALALDKYGTVWAWGGSCSEARKKTAEQWLNSPQTVPGIGGYYDPTSLGSTDNINNQSEDYNSYCANEDVIGFSSKTPIIISGLSSIKSISAGWGHTLAIDTEGNVWGLGCNLYNQVSVTPDHMKPYKFPQLKNIKQVSAGYRHSLALAEDGSVYAWGYNLRGDLGLGRVSESEKYPVKANISNVKEISASHDYSVVIDKNNKLFVFGENNSGIIQGDLNIIFSPNPENRFSEQNFESAAAGKNFILVLRNRV